MQKNTKTPRKKKNKTPEEKSWLREVLEGAQKDNKIFNEMIAPKLTKKLRPCPHCGATFEDFNPQTQRGLYVYFDTPNQDCKPNLRVGCLECGSSSPSIYIWNSRENL